MAKTTTEFVDECNYIYLALQSEAEYVEAEDYYLWEGTITKWMMNRRIATERYSKLMHALKSMGCIEVINRGTRYSPTQYALRFPPTTQLYMEAKADNRFEHKANRKTKAYDQMVRDLTARVIRLETFMEQMISDASQAS